MASFLANEKRRAAKANIAIAPGNNAVSAPVAGSVLVFLVILVTFVTLTDGQSTALAALAAALAEVDLAVTALEPAPLAAAALGHFFLVSLVVVLTPVVLATVALVALDVPVVAEPVDWLLDELAVPAAALAPSPTETETPLTVAKAADELEAEDELDELAATITPGVPRITAIPIINEAIKYFIYLPFFINFYVGDFLYRRLADKLSLMPPEAN